MAGPRRMWAKKGTIVLVASCAILLVAVLALTLLLPDARPRSADEAQAAVSDHLDDIVATLPAGSVTSDELTASAGPCPSDAGVQLVELRRVVALDSAFDLAAWPARLRDTFSADDGWGVSVRRVDTRGGLRITLVGTDLSIVTMGAGPTDAGSRLTLFSSSECTAE